LTKSVRARSLTALALACCLALVTRSASAEQPRVISLAPSLTEIAYAVGCGAALVGDTRYDNYPSAAKTLPHVADLAHADLERIAALQPTVILALHDQEYEGSTIQARLRVPIVYLPNRNIGDLYADIAGVAHACDRQAQGAKLADQMRAGIAKIAAASAQRAHHPSVFFLLGLPGFTAGKRSFVNDLIVLAGGVNVAGNIDEAYPRMSDEAILRANPDVIIVATDTQFGADVRAREPWRSMRAVRDGRVLRPPTDDILERNGPRLLQGLEWLSAALR
jgi:iron complex transport system substrate-binding protein